MLLGHLPGPFKSVLVDPDDDLREASGWKAGRRFNYWSSM